MEADVAESVWKFIEEPFAEMNSGFKNEMMQDQQVAQPGESAENSESTRSIGASKENATAPPKKPHTAPSLLDGESKCISSVMEARSATKGSWDVRMEMCLICNSSAPHLELDANGEVTYSDEYVVICHDCGECYHTYCLTPPISDKTKLKPSPSDWRCPQCKHCIICHQAHNESQLVICDRCDRCFHSYCAHLSAAEVAQDEWLCAECRVCSFCASSFAVATTALPAQRQYALCGSCNAKYDAKVVELVGRLRYVMEEEGRTIEEESEMAQPALASALPRKRSVPVLPAPDALPNAYASVAKNGAPQDQCSQPMRSQQGAAFASQPPSRNPVAAHPPLPPHTAPSQSPSWNTSSTTTFSDRSGPPWGAERPSAATLAANQVGLTLPRPAPLHYLANGSYNAPVRFQTEPQLQHHSLPPSHGYSPNQMASATPQMPSQTRGASQNVAGHPSRPSFNLPASSFPNPASSTHAHTPYSANAQPSSALQAPPQQLDRANYGQTQNHTFGHAMTPNAGYSATLPSSNGYAAYPSYQGYSDGRPPSGNGYQQAPAFISAPSNASFSDGTQANDRHGVLLQSVDCMPTPFLVEPGVHIVLASAKGEGLYPQPAHEWRQIFELSYSSYCRLLNFFALPEDFKQTYPALFVPAGKFPVVDQVPPCDVILHVLAPAAAEPRLCTPHQLLPSGTLILPPIQLANQRMDSSSVMTNQSAYSDSTMMQPPPFGSHVRPMTYRSQHLPPQPQQHPESQHSMMQGGMHEAAAFYSAPHHHHAGSFNMPSDPYQDSNILQDPSRMYTGIYVQDGRYAQDMGQPSQFPPGHHDSPQYPTQTTNSYAHQHQSTSIPYNPSAMQSTWPENPPPAWTSPQPALQPLATPHLMNSPVTEPQHTPRGQYEPQGTPRRQYQAPFDRQTGEQAGRAVELNFLPPTPGEHQPTPQHRPLFPTQHQSFQPQPSAAYIQRPERSSAQAPRPTKPADGMPGIPHYPFGSPPPGHPAAVDPTAPTVSSKVSPVTVKVPAPKNEKTAPRKATADARSSSANISTATTSNGGVIASQSHPDMAVPASLSQLPIGLPTAGKTNPFVSPTFNQPAPAFPHGHSATKSPQQHGISIASPTQSDSAHALSVAKREKRKRQGINISALRQHIQSLEAKLKVLLNGPPILILLTRPTREVDIDALPLEVPQLYVGYAVPLATSPLPAKTLSFTQRTFSSFDNKNYYADTRECVLCKRQGDHVALGRLLPMILADAYVHAACASWSSEVVESEDGELLHLFQAVHRAKTQFCKKCNQGGASLTCPVRGCPVRYHLPCAIQSASRFVAQKAIHYFICPTHASKYHSTIGDNPPNEKAALMDTALGIGEYSLAVFNTHRKLIMCESDIRYRTAKKEGQVPWKEWTQYMFRSGALIVHHIGEICPFSTFHTRDYIFPSGYHVLRRYWSYKQPLEDFGPFSSSYPPRTTYELLVTSVDHKAYFTIKCPDDPENIIEGPDYETVWNEVVARVNASRVPPSDASSSATHSPLSLSSSRMEEPLLLEMASSGAMMSASPSPSTTGHQPGHQAQIISQSSPSSSNSTIALSSSSGVFATPIKNHLGAAFFFGFECPQLVSHLERLPGALQLMRYRRKHDMVIRLPTVLTLAVTRYFEGEKASHILDAPPNESGAARCQPYKPLSASDRFKQLDAFPFHPAAALLSFTDLVKTRTQYGQSIYPHTELGVIRGSLNALNMITHSKVNRFRLMKTSENIRLKVLRSKIQGRGLFVMEDVTQGDYLIEYVGEIISHTMADVREKLYQRQGIGCYMFSLNKDFVIDATTKGNHSRFINHSCEPNCETVIEIIDGTPRILICAKFDIRQGEELTYDYAFTFEDDEAHLECHCGTPSCSGYMK